MSESPAAEAFAYERYIVPEAEGLAQAPRAAVDVYRREAGHGYPMAFAKHPEWGWAVLCSAGQGPMVDWKEADR